MKPVFEFLLACLLIITAGCSAIAGIFNAGMWAASISVVALAGLVILFKAKPKND